MRDIVIVANSPGELSALVKPAAETIARKLPDTRLTLVLTPCQYTSGKELEYIKTIRGITHTISANEYKNWILRNQKPKIDFQDKGLVLFLGGDLAHAILVAQKMRYPAYAYVQDYIGWTGSYKKFFIPDVQSQSKLDRRGLLKDKLQIVGNLMVDSVSDLPKWQPEKNVITFMPGSRGWQINHMTPIYQKIIDELKIQNPNFKIQVVSSPFEQAISIPGVKTISFEDAHNSELVITIPGTNTARLAARGIPMLVVFPLDNIEVIPLEGIAHYISQIPYFGIRIKKKFAEITNRHTRFFALPNIKADREVVEEIRGVINPKEVAEKAIALLNDLPGRQKMSMELIEAMGKPGAAEIISDIIKV
jgi:lipid-A-disaccharide synthase